MERIRILYLIDEMHALSAGGTERQVLQMIQLSAQAGLEPTLCVLRGTHWLTEAQAGCRIRHGNLGRILSPGGLTELFRLLSWMRRERFHVVQTFFIDGNVIGPILARLARVPVVLGSRRNLNYWMSSRFQKVQRLANLFVTELVANCQAVKGVVVATEKISANKVRVLYNGIDTSTFDADPVGRAQARNRLQLGDDDVLVGTVANFTPVKGIEEFVRAAALVVEKSPHAHFLLIGDGPMRSQLEAMIGELGLHRRFHILGSQDNVVPYLNALDVAVLPSRAEGFSNSLLEYMAVGLACVATDVGGAREALGEAAGILVAPGDPAALAHAILELVQDGARRSALAAAGYRRVRTLFSLDQTRTRLLGYYLRLLSATRAEIAVPVAAHTPGSLVVPPR
jgi:glycosyltransferase involved in cell wall biosynthesis